MALEIVKTTKLTGNLKIGEELVKTITVEFDAKGTPTITEWIANEELYRENRKEIRKQKAQFDAKRFEVEDAIAAELEESN